jgi:hypothetical protein
MMNDLLTGNERLPNIQKSEKWSAMTEFAKAFRNKNGHPRQSSTKCDASDLTIFKLPM